MRLTPALILACLVLLVAGGCVNSPKAYAPAERPTLDRRGVEFPPGLEMSVVIKNLTAATAVVCGERGEVFVADRGARGGEVRIQRLDTDAGELVELYPARNAIVSWFDRRERYFGPVGGLAWRGGELYASVRDADDAGLILAFDLRGWKPGDGRPPVRTVVADLPAQGDHPVTALAFHPITGRLFFGVGSATNSGVVGLDSWQSGWLREHPTVHDRPLVPLKIFGYRFDTEDPAAGLLNPDKVNTAPFNAFGQSGQRVPAARDGKPNAAVYSVHPRGGDLVVEAHGLRMPAGLAFNSFANLWATNQGMELRGTRPVKDDPDALVRIFASGASDAAGWYGWPDYSADFRPITDASFQPPRQMLARTGYSELSFLIERSRGSGTTVGLSTPDRDTLLGAVFPPLSGASGLAFVPKQQPGLEAFEGQALVALRGDRAPLATSGLPLKRPQGRVFAVVDLDRGTWRPLVYNTREEEDSRVIHRPIDVAFDRDGGLWLLDQGEMRIRDGREKFKPGTGRLLRLAPASSPPLPSTRPRV